MAEWLKAHAWKACIPQGIQGSNPCLSAITFVINILRMGDTGTNTLLKPCSKTDTLLWTDDLVQAQMAATEFWEYGHGS
jgi:hypothetical protein